MSANIEEELRKFQEKWGIENEEALAGLKEELKTAADHGSDDKKKEEIQDLLNQYNEAGVIKIHKLGGGAYGEVYKSLNLKTKEVVAVKIIDLEEAKDDILVIKREIDALADVSSCKQFVQYKGTHLLGTKLWIVMEFVKGGSLGDVLKKKGAVTEAQAAVIAREALFGLQHLHSNNRIHRDIKAANLLIQEDCQVKLGDLGATVQLTTSKPSSDTMIGSPYWMAPEVLRQDKHDSKADVWSLGITCIELVKGKPPNSHLPALRIVMLVPMSPAPKLEGDYSDTFKDFISQCLQKNTDTRPSVKDLLEHPFIKGAGELSELQSLLTS